MKLLFLCKQRPMGRDLLRKPYGRFYNIPCWLSRKGHDVTVLLHNYKNELDRHAIRDSDGVCWHSISMKRYNPFRYYLYAKQFAQTELADCIVGFSDTYYGIFAQWLASGIGCRSVIDAYDNYESYLWWCKPLHLVWRCAISRADLVTVAGPSLYYLVRKYRSHKPIKIVPMIADSNFMPLDRHQCRDLFNLPQGRKIIGYCGSVSSSRGIELLFDAFEVILTKLNNIELVLSGRLDSKISLPSHVRWLGYLPENMLPQLLNCMNVLTVLNKSSAFGEHSYPVKLYEAMSCKIPVAVSSTEATRWILKDFPEFLFPPNNCEKLVEVIVDALEQETIDYGQLSGWSEYADLFEKFMISH